MKEKRKNNMDRFTDERDDRLLEADRFTFQVLKRIILGECRLLLSDHENLIVCYSAPPFPVWIWTPDHASEAVMEKAWQLVKEYGLLKEGCHFNLKYELAEYFITRAKAEGRELSVLVELLAYECLHPVKPQHPAEGRICLGTMEDLEELTDFKEAFHNEVAIDIQDREQYRKNAVKDIESGKMYFWADPKGNHAACCKYTQTGDIASVSFVYTPPAYRRKHYAQNLVYQVTVIAKEAGLIPMIYTDANYPVSNACYQKVGYELRGRLCMIGE